MRTRVSESAVQNVPYHGISTANSNIATMLRRGTIQMTPSGAAALKGSVTAVPSFSSSMLGSAFFGLGAFAVVVFGAIMYAGKAIVDSLTGKNKRQ